MAEDRPISTVNSDYATPMHSPLNLDNGTLEPPRASFFNPGPSPDLGNTPRDSIAASTGAEQSRDGLTPAESTTFLPAGKESETVLTQRAIPTKPLYRRPAFLAVAAAAVVAIILIVVLPVYFVVIHKNNNSSKAANGNGSGSGSGSGNGNGKNPPSSSNAITGGDGSTIVSGNTSFIYHNPFGGYCESSLALQLHPCFFFGALLARNVHQSYLFLTLCYASSVSPCLFDYWL